MTLEDYYSQSYPPSLWQPRDEIVVPPPAKPGRRPKVTAPAVETSEPADE